MMQIIFILAYCIFSTNAFYVQKSLKFNMKSLDKNIKMALDLDTSDFENLKFTQVQDISADFGKFRLEATIKSSEMNEFLNEYKKEMQRRKVLFPGFRPGKLPPYVMPDVRKYLVCYGLEATLGQLCNINGLKMCSESKEDVAFGEDSYYEQIIQKDFRDFDYTKQRDTWREGTDFSFVAEFFAQIDSKETNNNNDDSNKDDESIINKKNAIDVETVDSSA